MAGSRILQAAAKKRRKVGGAQMALLDVERVRVSIRVGGCPGRISRRRLSCAPAERRIRQAERQRFAGQRRRVIREWVE